MIGHVRRPAPQVQPPARGERGETLIEMLATVVLMGIGFVALLSAIFAAVTVSEANANKTKASNSVQSWAEGFQQPVLNQAPTANPLDSTTYQPCATPGSYGTALMPSGALPTIPSGWSAEVTEVLLLRNFAGGKPVFTLTTGECYALPSYGGPAPGDRQRDNGLQQITIRITSPPGSKFPATDTLVFVKRDQRCPTTFDNADLGPC